MNFYIKLLAFFRVDWSKHKKALGFLNYWYTFCVCVYGCFVLFFLNSRRQHHSRNV